MIKVELKGLEKTALAFNKLGGTSARRSFAAALRKGQEPLKDAAVSKAPVGLTGQLSDKIKVRVKKPTPDGITAVLITNPAIPRKKGSTGRGRLNSYAAFVEFGTRNQSAQPFMRSALEEQGLNVIEETKKSIIRRIERIFA